MQQEAISCARSNTPDHYASLREGRFVSGDEQLFRNFATLVMEEDASSSPREMLRKMHFFMSHSEQHPPPIINPGAVFDAKQTPRYSSTALRMSRASASRRTS